MKNGKEYIMQLHLAPVPMEQMIRSIGAAQCKNYICLHVLNLYLKLRWVNWVLKY